MESISEIEQLRQLLRTTAACLVKAENALREWPLTEYTVSHQTLREINDLKAEGIPGGGK